MVSMLEEAEGHGEAAVKFQLFDNGLVNETINR